jgi:hypothetical protein
MTPPTTHHPIRHHRLQGFNLQQLRCVNLKYHKADSVPKIGTPIHTSIVFLGAIKKARLQNKRTNQNPTAECATSSRKVCTATTIAIF